MTSLFQSSVETGKLTRDKVLIYGPTHTSKTHAALTFPKPAIVNVENRAGHFTDRFEFLHARPRTHADVLAVLEEARRGALQCETVIFDSYSADYEKLVARHTTEIETNGKLVVTTDYVTVNKRIAPVREFAFAAVTYNVVFIAHQQQKFDRNGNNFTRRNQADFRGDEKFRFAFDYIFRTESTGPDPRVAPVKFHVEKSASPHLKLGVALAVRPDESFYKIFRSRIAGSAGTPGQSASSAPAPAAPEGMISDEQAATIKDLARSLHLGQLELADYCKNVSRRSPHLMHLMAAEAARVIAVLERKVKDVA